MFPTTQRARRFIPVADEAQSSYRIIRKRLATPAAFPIMSAPIEFPFIMPTPLTQSFSFVGSTAQLALSWGFVNQRVFRAAFANHQILRSIVCAVPVYVVNFFARLKRPAYFVLGNNNVFQYVSANVSSWVRRKFDADVAIPFVSAAFPVWVSFACVGHVIRLASCDTV